MAAALAAVELLYAAERGRAKAAAAGGRESGNLLGFAQNPRGLKVIPAIVSYCVCLRAAVQCAMITRRGREMKQGRGKEGRGTKESGGDGGCERRPPLAVVALT